MPAKQKASSSSYEQSSSGPAKKGRGKDRGMRKRRGELTEEERLQKLDELLGQNQQQREASEEIGENFDWDRLKKIKKKNKQHTRAKHKIEIGPNIFISRRQILTVLFMLELDSPRLKSIPTTRIARSCKHLIRESPMFDVPINSRSKEVATMHDLKMSRAALDRLTLYVEKKLEDVLRWGYVLSISQKKKTLTSANVLTARELMNGAYNHNQAVNFNDLKKRYNCFTDEQQELEQKLEDVGLRSIDQIYSILENCELIIPGQDMYVPFKLDMALREDDVKQKLTAKGKEFLAKLKQQQPTEEEQVEEEDQEEGENQEMSDEEEE
ncbi:hypothetical protein FDP41_004281 [Naegleria fowleri]|uniref:Uncharacterized protein n=1 Tax=Naegleria fowleri TaxID=5763 RepID=A0A6A5BPP2_NAEFO|nr:uncharacterized protein FDP41_004281 [Naegleria fowleri]KAF0976986.1 hypothetical protein FDP41_004281 [Naegleria fowleri]CAG4716740.1 unnamed protein product [Naegleria fowleri]